MEEQSLRKIIREELTQQMLMNKEVLSVKEAAVYAGWTPDYIRRLIVSGDIRANKPLGKVYFIHRTDLIDFMMGRGDKLHEEADRLAQTYMFKKKLNKNSG